jgi:hypothetical protein
MTHTNLALRVGGMWLSVASFLLIAALGFHGPIAPHLHDQMTRIADAPLQWSVVHWLAAAALSLYAISGLVILTSRSRLTEGPWTMSAWAVLIVGAFWTVTTALVETTVVTNAAVAGNSEMFETWWMFAEAKANGFAFLALSVAVIAGNEARNTEGVTPTWSAWSAMVAAVLSFAGWVLGMWLGVGIGNLLWVVSSILMTVWTLCFGINLMKSRVKDKK